MHTGRFLTIILFGFSLAMLTAVSAFAERDCTREIVRSDGTKTVTTDCTSSYTQNSTAPIPEDVFNQYLYSTLSHNLQGSVDQGLQDSHDKVVDTSTGQPNLDQIAADSQEKEQEAIDAQRLKEEDSKH